MLLIIILQTFNYYFYNPSSALMMKHPENNACTRLRDYPFKAFSSNCYVNPNVLATTPEMIQLNGYNFEEYEVVTKDGYRSKMFRIPPNENDNRKKRQPVILNHGVMVNSAVWTWMGNRSLAFVLANAGYDVWLVNQRDSGYTTHNIYKSSDYNFWNYDFDTIAENDMPAILNTVVEVTNKSGSIIYIGHSRGASLLLMYASENPKEAEKILRGYIALAPVVHTNPAYHLKILFSFGNLLYMLKIPVLFAPAQYTVKFLQTFCSYFPHACKLFLALSSGRVSQFSPDDLLAYYTFCPAPVTTKQFTQLVQVYRSGQFKKFDYGKKENLRRYGQEVPPFYNLGNIKFPTYLFYGKYDIYIKEKDIKKVFEELGSSEKEYFKVPVGIEVDKLQFSHNDFCWSKYIEELFYKDLFQTLDKLKPK